MYIEMDDMPTHILNLLFEHKKADNFWHINTEILQIHIK